MQKWLALPVAVLLAGCFQGGGGREEFPRGSSPYPYHDPAHELYHYRQEVAGGGSLSVHWAPVALSTAWTDGETGTFEFPAIPVGDEISHVLVLDGNDVGLDRPLLGGNGHLRCDRMTRAGNR